MSARITVETLLRDDDDMSGQSIREWKLEIEQGFITIRMRHSNGFILIRAADVDQLVADLRKAEELAKS